MKNNYNELFKKKISKYQRHGIFNIRDVAKEIYSEFEFLEKTRKKDQFAWLKMQYILTRLESDLSSYDCFSFKKNEFVSLDKATLKNLISMDENFEASIRGRDNTLQRIREKIKELNKHKGQMELQINGSKIVGIDEVKSIEDLLPGSET